MKHLTLSFTLLALAACGGGGGGGGALLLSPTQQANSATASSASLASSQSQAANTSISAAVANLSELVSSNPALTSNSAVTSAAVAAQNAVGLAAAAQTAASTAAADLAAASTVIIIGVVIEGRTICAAAASCTKAEISGLGFKAAETAKNAAEASLYAITATNQLKTLISSVAPSVNVSTATAAIASAESSATSAQATANLTISNLSTAAREMGVTITTITPSSGSTGSVAGSPSYSGNTQTIVTTFGNGQTSTATNTATGTAVTWATDNVTKTTTYTYANGGTNTVVATVAGVAGTPTYSGNTQTIVTTFGNGQTSTATNTANGSADTWATDNVTKTTTYTYANGGTNAVVATVPAVASTPVLTAAVYPSDWTTTGTVSNPSVSSITNTFGNGVVTTIESGTSLLPFNQSSLSAQLITDPSAVVRSSTTDYNLIWGTPDKNGPAYSALFSNVNQITVNNPFTMWGATISGQCPGGPIFGFCLNGATIATPHPEVIDAWQKGWTGKNVNIMIEDYLEQDHGVVVTTLVERYAPAATFYGFNVQTGLGTYNYSGGVASPSSIINIGVVNASYGANLAGIIGRSNTSLNLWSSTELANAATQYQVNSQTDVNRISVANSSGNFNYTDAVVVKAAGNDGISADQEPFNKALANSSNINPRLLIVGALNQAGFVSSLATIESYSNIAGSDSSVSSRFLVASGTTPFGNGYMARNGVAIEGTTFSPDGRALSASGTSYAAPRVAGYVAILRSKFPNLDAVKSSSIILDTARYDTLTCHPSCDPAIYGKGEASLSRALAPVGRLR